MLEFLRDARTCALNVCLRFNGNANSLIFYDHLLFQAAAAPAVGFKFSPTKGACGSWRALRHTLTREV